MKGSQAFLACAALVVGILSLPRPAQGQDRAWDFSLSAFAGGALPLSTDVTRRGSALGNPITSTTGSPLGVPFSFTGKDLALKSSVSVGGKLTGWWMGLRQGSHLDCGAELDLTQSFPSIKGQTASAAGRINGLPVSGLSVPFPGVDISSTILALNVLLRWPLGVRPDLPNGRWYPYLGGGGGLDIGHANSLGLPQTDTGPAWQALGGVSFFLARNLAAFAEYKFTQATHTFRFSWEYEKETASLNHFVAGLSWHF